MDIKERIQRLRQKMKERNMDAYIIPSSDPPHERVYSPRWQAEMDIGFLQVRLELGCYNR